MSTSGPRSSGRGEIAFERSLIAALYAPFLAGWVLLASNFLAWTPNETAADLGRMLPVIGVAQCDPHASWAFAAFAAAMLALTAGLLVTGLRAVPETRAYRSFGIAVGVAVIAGGVSAVTFYWSVCSVHSP